MIADDADLTAESTIPEARNAEQAKRSANTSAGGVGPIQRFPLNHEAGSDSRQRRCQAPVKEAAICGTWRKTHAFSACSSDAAAFV